MKIYTIKEIQCNKTYKVFEALIDCNIGIKCFHEYLANSKKFEFAFTYKTINTFAEQIEKFKRLLLEGLQEKYKCNESGEYHKNALYVFAELKCRNYQLDKARVNYLCKVFFKLAHTLPENTDYIIFKQEN